MSLFPRLLPTGVGSLPHTEPSEAIQFVKRHLTEYPFWPQLPRREQGENMYFQFSHGIPGFHWDGGKGVIDIQGAPDELLGFYQMCLDGAGQDYALGKHAAGYEAFLNADWPGALAVKGQVTGPISIGLSLTEPGGKPILYDEAAMDVVCKHLAMVARSQEQGLANICDTTIVFLDEPYISTYGSAYFSYGKEQVVHYLTEAFSGIQGISGIHCCGNTDWQLVMETPVDIVSFDAYDYLEQFCLYATHIKEFLERGGHLAWGIVPHSAEAEGETPENLASHFQKGLELLKGRGVSTENVLEHSFLTPACGLGGLDEGLAERIFTLLEGISRLLKKRYDL